MITVYPGASYPGMKHESSARQPPTRQAPGRLRDAHSSEVAAIIDKHLDQVNTVCIREDNFVPLPAD